jgi:hypothetical protein
VSYYALRVGWNLPDKEFRYLRTIIFTVSVHQGFSHWLPCHMVINFLNIPALGSCQPPVHGLMTLWRPVFLVHSHLSLVIVTSFVRRPFSRSYGAILIFYHLFTLVCDDLSMLEYVFICYGKRNERCFYALWIFNDMEN